MVSRSVRLTAASGDSILFSTEKGGAFIFESIRSTGTPAVTIFTTQSPGMHGAYREEALLEPREMTLSVYVSGDPGLVGDACRQSMDKNLLRLNRLIGQVQKDLTITYNTTYGSYVAYGTVSAQVEQGARKVLNGRHYTPVTLTIFCARPLWYAPEWSTADLRYNSRGIKFPFKLSTSFGIGGYRRTIRNSSAASLPLQIDIIGPAAMPTISNTTTGASMSLSKPLLSGERLFIDTDPDNISVVYQDIYGNRISAVGYLTDDSDFLQLAPGSNTLVFESGDDLQNATVVLRWRQAFTGV